MLKHRSFEGFNIKQQNDFLESRKPVLTNNDCTIVLAAPQNGTKNYFYKNADADEVIFIHEGQWHTVYTQYGELSFGYGDYLVLPRGTIYQIVLMMRITGCSLLNRITPIRFPKKYLSKYGQLMEHSPYCERDIRPPQNIKTYDEAGDFIIKTKKQNMLYGIHYGHHPFDVVGWDGCCYPFHFFYSRF